MAPLLHRNTSCGTRVFRWLQLRGNELLQCHSGFKMPAHVPSAAVPGPRVRPALCRNRLPFPTGLLTFEDGSEVVAGRAGHLLGRGGGWNVGRDGRGRNSGVSPVLWSFGADDTSVSPWMNLRSNAFCSPLSPPLTQGPVTACARGQQRGPVRLSCVWNPVSLSSLD